MLDDLPVGSVITVLENGVEVRYIGVTYLSNGYWLAVKEDAGLPAQLYLILDPSEE